ncbi:MAG: M24 family metallopeptidase [Burkholderiales bacterium]|nr:M24 family metallopeptidase [Burkholderiales bacterium]
MKDYSPFISRRKRLLEKLGGVAIVPTAPHQQRNRDSHYPYRFDSHFYYLTGFPEPEAVLVMVGGENAKSMLFCRERDEEREIWDGHRFGPARAKEVFGFDETHPVSALEGMLPELLKDQPSVYHPLGADEKWDAKVLTALNAVRAQARSGVEAPENVADIRCLVDEMRLFKDDYEISLMRRAAQIASNAHRIAMRTARPGAREYEVEAELFAEFRRSGAQAPSYTPIVAGGGNACILHYVENDEMLRAGELLLIDAGCELDGYASDITRTFPVGGKFSAAQKDVYEIVLEAQLAAISEVKPGSTWDSPHEAAVRVLATGLVDLGLCRGSVDSVVESGDYKRFYMHRTGHWLGLDVHDVGSYKSGGKWRALEPGMALTVEPGCYIRPSESVPEAFWNIGIRIEDDVVVTRQGCEILSFDAPKTVKEIEDWMAK